MKHKILNDLKEKILLLDGATGTMIQKKNLTESDFRNDNLKNITTPLKGNNDLLNLTTPDVIESIHLEYLLAGSDIIETNTFNSTSISQSDYQTQDYVYKLNTTACKLAKNAIKKYREQTHDTKNIYIAGSVGPTNKTISISPDVLNPSFRSVSFDELLLSHKEQIYALIDGGVDLILLETIFDGLNAKAALLACQEAFDEKNISLPIMISATITDKSGRLLSGQTIEAFFQTMKNPNIISFGMNCAFGAEELVPFVKSLSPKVPLNLSIYPNAGLPNDIGEFDELPEMTVHILKDLVDNKSINIVGGCCGTTPAHINAMRNLIDNKQPRPIPSIPTKTVYCGLETLELSKENNFINIGERNNVAGSRKFARLIKEKNYDAALAIAREQVENGAQIIDINFDDALLDSKYEMQNFLKLVASEPEISKVPLMIDSSNWDVLEVGLKCIQGKHIVNSISLKEGEADFLKKASIIKKFGCAVVVMAFDEQGQADTYERKIQICKRSYDLLINKISFPPEDIIFDPNILAIGTGIDEHKNYGLDYINATRWIKNNLPHAKISGGISNLSFSFRGNNEIREAMHSVFLYHAIKAGLDMGILNAGMIQIYEEIDKIFLEKIENLVLNKTDDALEELIEFSKSLTKRTTTENSSNKLLWREENTNSRISYSIIKGISEYIEYDVLELIGENINAIEIIEGPLMYGMNTVGELFGDGKMFLPQVIKSARVMKKAVDALKPYLEKNSSKTTKIGKVLLATVKGDVHDIGKNIVSIVLSCNNFEVIDLGIMVPYENILIKAKDLDVDIVGLSGLITPSLTEMIYVAKEFNLNNLDIPIIIGGATTSILHTSLKIEPEYKQKVFYCKDASNAVQICKNLCNPTIKNEFINDISKEYSELRENYSTSNINFLTLNKARDNGLKLNFNNVPKPNLIGTKTFLDYSLKEVRKYIDWTYFFISYEMRKKFPEILSDQKFSLEATILYEEANKVLDFLESSTDISIRGVIGFFPANSKGDDIIVYNSDERTQTRETLNFFRSQQVKDNNLNLCLSDFIAPENHNIKDYIGCFALTTKIYYDKISKKLDDSNVEYDELLIKILCNRLVEAFAELIHIKVESDYWGYSNKNPLNPKDNPLDYKFESNIGIRPAIGYPIIPDHSEKIKVLNLLEFDTKIGAKLTDNFMMDPQSSVCGYYISHPESKYFDVGKILDDQLTDYCKRKGLPIEEIKRLIPTRLP